MLSLMRLQMESQLRFQMWTVAPVCRKAARRNEASTCRDLAPLPAWASRSSSLMWI